ncbi:MAG: response regulator [Bacteroidia bacterium]
MEKPLLIMLADDDDDDRYFFAQALEALTIPTTLVTVDNGEKLMHYLLKHTNKLPDILFLDINMPRKKGSDCLKEIKSNKDLKKIPIIIYSTCLNEEFLDELYTLGAHYCMQKSDLSELIKDLKYLFQILLNENFKRATREGFIIHSQQVL